MDILIFFYFCKVQGLRWAKHLLQRVSTAPDTLCWLITNTTNNYGKIYCQR